MILFSLYSWYKIIYVFGSRLRIMQFMDRIMNNEQKQKLKITQKICYISTKSAFTIKKWSGASLTLNDISNASQHWVHWFHQSYATYSTILMYWSALHILFLKWHCHMTFLNQSNNNYCTIYVYYECSSLISTQHLVLSLYIQSTVYSLTAKG